MGLRIRWNDLAVDVPLDIEAAGGDTLNAYVATAMDAACYAQHGCAVAEYAAQPAPAAPAPGAPTPTAGPTEEEEA